MNRAALVIMAAGMASRYGGNKQIDGMGPNGEILMEYSIRDAIRAGFTKAVIIIKRGMLDRMKEICGDRLSKEIEVCYAFQEYETLPEWYTVPEGRVKPYGTVHAVLCARELIDEPFAVINADDYYGVESFAQMYGFLMGLKEPNQAAMMGYRLKHTVSRNGTVTRGICRVEGGCLAGVREMKRIALGQDGVISEISDAQRPVVLDPESLVSMNFWGFPKEIFREMEKRFEEFLKEKSEDELRTEYLLPVMVDEMIRGGQLRVHVLETEAIWFGVTHREDQPIVARELLRLHNQGLY